MDLELKGLKTAFAGLGEASVKAVCDAIGTENIRAVVQAWRDELKLQSQVRIGRLIRDVGLKIGNREAAQIGDRILVRAIQEVGLLPESEVDLYDRWVNLLVSASSIDVEARALVAPSFPDVLAQLTGNDVKMLDAIYNLAHDVTNAYVPDKTRVRFNDYQLALIMVSIGLAKDPGFGLDAISDQARNLAEKAALDLFVSNCLRLGLIRDYTDVVANFGNRGQSAKISFSLTTYGLLFIKACSTPHDSESGPEASSADSTTGD